MSGEFRPRPGKANLFLAWIALLFLLAPLAVVFPVSFTAKRYLSMPEGEYSLRHYRDLVTDPDWYGSVLDSLIVACGATAMALVMGTMVGIACWRLSSRLAEAVRVAMLAPIIVPPIVHALGFYQVWVQLGLIDTHLGLILAHGLKGTPYVVISVSAALANTDLRLEQAARSLGARAPTVVRTVILPLAMPGIVSGGIFAFVTSWDELVVNLFITQRTVHTLPRQIWDGIQDNISPAVAAAAVVLILLTFAATAAIGLFGRRRG